MGCSGARGSPSCARSPARFSSSTARRCARQAAVSGAARRGRGQPAQRLAQVAVELRGDGPGMLARRLGGVEHDQLALLAEGLPEPEPEVQRDPHDEADVGVLERRAAGAGEEERVVRGDAAARQPVEEHGHAERLGERPQRLLPAAPVEVGAGHDHRALRVAEQGRRALERARLGRRRRMGRRGGRLGLLGLHEHVVEREVQERRPAVRPQRRRPARRRSAPGSPPSRTRSPPASRAVARTARGRSPAASPGPSAARAPGPRAPASGCGTAARSRARSCRSSRRGRR